MNIQDWFPLGLTGLISLQSKGLSKSLLQHHSSKASVLQHSAFFMVQLLYPYMTTGKIIALTIWNFVSKVISLLFNMLSRLVIAFLPRNKYLLISWLQLASAEILEPKKVNPVTVTIISPSISHEVMGLDTIVFVLWMLRFKPAFSCSFSFIKRLFSSSSHSAIKVVSSAYLRFIDISPSKLDSSLCFIQPSILHNVVCIYVKYTEWQYTGLTYSFLNFEPVVPCLILTVAFLPT